MGSVYNRGTAEKPRWYGNYIECDGRRVNRRLLAVERCDAEVAVKCAEERVARGELGMTRRTRRSLLDLAPPDESLGWLVLRFLREAKLRSRTPEKYRASLGWLLKRHVIPTLGRLPLLNARAQHFEALFEDLVQAGYKVRSVNAVVRACSVMFTWARRAGLWEKSNPVAGLLLTVREPEMGFLSEAEVLRLLAVAAAQSWLLWTVLRAALWTGLRKGELFGLRWADVDFPRAIIHVRHSFHAMPKSGRTRVLPLHPELAQVLMEHRQQGEPHPLVFPVQGRMAHRHELLGLPMALRAAGIADLARPWHTLRHTFASHFVMNGGNLLALQRILGHARFEMTQIYSHLSPGFLSQEILRVPWTKKHT